MTSKHVIQRTPLETFTVPWHRLFGVQATREVKVVGEWYGHLIVEDDLGRRNMFHPSQLRAIYKVLPWRDTTDWIVVLKKDDPDEPASRIVRSATSRKEAHEVAKFYLREGYDSAWLIMR